MVNYTESIVAYIDILGFEKRVEEQSADELLQNLQLFRLEVDPPEDMDFPTLRPEISTFSDMALIWHRLESQSPGEISAALILTILKLSEIQHGMIKRGLLVRGGVTIGSIYGDRESEGGIVFGPAFIEAYKIEKNEAVYPRIVISPELLLTVENIDKNIHVTKIIKNLKWIHKMIKEDNDRLSFIDYLGIPLTYQFSFRDRREYVRAHKKLILENRPEKQELSSIGIKYAWLTNYHNNFVNDLDSDYLEDWEVKREDLLIET